MPRDRFVAREFSEYFADEPCHAQGIDDGEKETRDEEAESQGRWRLADCLSPRARSARGSNPKKRRALPPFFLAHRPYDLLIQARLRWGYNYI